MIMCPRTRKYAMEFGIPLEGDSAKTPESNFEARVRVADALRESGETEAADDLDRGKIAASYVDYFDIPGQGRNEAVEAFNARVFKALSLEGLDQPHSVFQEP
jgi:hypothetical protein